MDAYSEYNQIPMNLVDSPKTVFMTSHIIYYYEVMPFGLKNIGVTYQRLMDTVFSSQIGRNMEVYMEGMMIKTPEGRDHVVDMEEMFVSVTKFNMRLNPDKGTFGVPA